jgi:hypothetical protein
MISWSSESYENEGKITRCVLVDGAINILFEVMDDGESVQGRISLKPTNDEQTTEGYWNYPDTKKQNPLSSISPLDSDEINIKAIVTGKLQNFRGKSVAFSGIWDETVWDKEEGDVCDFELDAYIEE